MLAVLFLFIVLNLAMLPQYRLHSLFLSSMLFIAYVQWQAVPVILFNICIAFFFAKKIEEGDEKNLWFVGGIILILMQLLGIKIIGGNIGFSFKWIAVAIGLSFYSLQNIAYLVEVKLKNIEAERSFLHYATFTSFFPKILSGPIMTYADFRPQLDVQLKVTKENIIAGFNRFLLGLVKKMVLADRLAPMVASVFDSDEPSHGFTALFAGFVFTLQVFFDFSAYIDMAIGAARMMGFTLPENFNSPFKAKSINEFWKRWNITLMLWLEHYIYLPLSFLLRQKPVLSVLIPVAATLIFSALWHGVGLTFMLWGMCHIFYLLMEWKFKQQQKNVPTWMAHILCLLGVSFANIFFRSQNLDTVAKMMGEIFSIGTFLPNNWYAGFIAVFARGGELTEQFNFAVTWFLIVLYFIFEKKIYHKANAQQLDIRYVFVLISLFLVFAVFSSGEEFIYARF